MRSHTPHLNGRMGDTIEQRLVDRREPAWRLRRLRRRTHRRHQRPSLDLEGPGFIKCAGEVAAAATTGRRFIEPCTNEVMGDS
jgi:hypothetical protein